MEQAVENTQQTTVAPQPQVQYSGFGRRFFAYFVDYFFLYVISLFLLTALGHNPLLYMSKLFEATTMEELNRLQASSSDFLNTGVYLLISALYFMLSYVNYDGATLGKRVMAIKVTRTDGSKVTYPVALFRYLGMFVSLITFGIGYLWVLFDSKKQSLHDKIAGTVVVKTNAKPKTFLAVIITIVMILYMVLVLTASFAKGFEIGMKNVKEKQKVRIIDSTPAKSEKEDKNNMVAEAKLHYDKVQELFKKLNENVKNVDALKPLADEAIKEAKAAVDLDPKTALLWSTLGDTYTWPNTVGKSEDSLNAYKTAEKLDPNNVVYINYVGDALIRLGRNDEAVLQLQKTLRLTDTSGYGHVSIGRAYFNLKIYDEARKHLERGIEIFKGENSKGNFDKDILSAQALLAGIPK